MLNHYPTRYARIALLSVTLVTTTPTLASIVLPGGDSFQDGSFQGMTYGASGTANLAPRLYVSDLGGVSLPPYDQVQGTGLDFSYDPPNFNSSMVTFTYRLTNNDLAPFSNLRFFLDLKTKGQTSFLDTGAAVGFGAPANPGDPNQFQIFDFDAPGDKPLQQIESGSLLNGNIAPACTTGCYTDLALQWNRDELLVGDTWVIQATLIDDPSLVAGGRYLTASTLGPDGTQIFFGNVTPVPIPPALWLFGSGIIGLVALQRRPGAST